jgi:cytochrome b subunit of formate dehydrogenase
MDCTKRQLRKRKLRGYLYDFGRFLVDISKLAFGSLVLGTAIRWDIPHKTLFFVGLIFTFIVAFTGIIIARTSEEK